MPREALASSRNMFACVVSRQDEVEEAGEAGNETATIHSDVLTLPVKPSTPMGSSYMIWRQDARNTNDKNISNKQMYPVSR